MSEYPRITYQCSGRAFDRLFKEQSLDETKVVVRKKLGLSHDAPIELAQMRDGRKVDLEDDDDFEAFKALTNISLHATVAVIIREDDPSPNSVGMNASREGENHPNDPHSGPHAQEAAQSGVVAPITESPLQSPATPATGTFSPRKKRKVAFDDDIVTSADPQHSHQPPSLSRKVPPTVVHNTTSGAAALPPSTPRSQTQMADSGKPKRKAAKITPSDADVNPTEATAEPSRKKQKKINGAALRKEIPPEHEASNPANLGMPSNTRKKGKQKSRVADTAETSGAKSKTRSIDPATNEMPGPTKSHESGALKKKVDSEVSNSGAKIDETISAFLTRRLQADPSTFSALVTASQLAAEVEAPPPKTQQKGSKVKSRAGVDDKTHAVAQKPSASSVETSATNSATGRIVRKATRGTSKPRRSSTEQNDVEPRTPVVTVANVEETLENSRDPNSERRFDSSEPPETDLGSKLSSAQQGSCHVSLTNREHPVTDDPDVQEGLESIKVRAAQIEKNPGHTSPTVAVCQKVRSTPSDLSRDSSDRESTVLTSMPTADSKGSSNAGAQLTIPKGIEISEVPVEAHHKGSSDESSTEGDTEWDGSIGTTMGSVHAPPVSVHPLADQLTALIRGTVKRGPRSSILDEIPSSSETGSESNAEDLVLDEEEDLSRQPSHKLSRTLSKTRAPSSEPEQTSEDEDDASVPVYMDSSHKVPHRPETLPAIGETGDHVSTSVEVEASKQPEGDTYPAGSPEAQNQDRSIRPPIAPNEVDATAPPSQSSTPIPRPASPESDATAINTEPAKSPILASDQADRVLVPASSSMIDRTAASTKEVSQLQTNDDVEPAVELPGCGEESDPIEPEPTQPPANRSRRAIGPTPRRRASYSVLKPPPVSELPSRRSGRLANRRPSASTSEVTLVPLSQVRRKMTKALETSIAKEENRRIRDDVEEATREKDSRKQVGKSWKRPTTQHSGESGHETSPSVAREDGSARTPNPSQPKWTTLPLLEQAHTDASSVIDEPRTSTQGFPAKLTLATGADGPSTSNPEKKTPASPRRGIIPPSRGKKGVKPLFFPGSSQIPAAPSPAGSEDESDVDIPLLPRKTPANSTPRNASTFRRLTDLANNDILFSKSKAARQLFNNTPTVKVLSRLEANDDEEDEESDSSSEASVVNSHIPKERRAGATTRRKGQGLSSLSI